MKLKNILLSLTIVFSLGLTVSTATAQVPNPAAPDLSMLTNHASLVKWAFKQVQGVQVQYSSGVQANNAYNESFLPITNQVVTLAALNAAVTPYGWSLPLTDTTTPLSLYVQLWNTNLDPSYGNYPDAYPLFYGYGGGTPIPGPFGSWTLATNDTALQLQLSSQVRIKIPGLYDARLVVHDQSGAYGMSLPVQNGELYFNSDYAGVGTLVLFTEFQDTNGNWWGFNNGYSLTNGAPATLSYVDFSVLLRDSDDFKAFKNPSAMDVSVYSYMDNSGDGLTFGKVPLLMPSFTALTKSVTLGVHSLDGQYATSYIIENEETGVTKTVAVPSNATSVQFDFPAGDYDIVPVGIKFSPPEEYNSYYGIKG